MEAGISRGRLRGWGVAGVALATALVAASCGGGGGSSEGPSSDEKFELTFASWIGEDNAQGRTVKWWMEEITERTDGRVSFDAHWASSLLPPEEIMSGTAQGRADVGHMTVAYNPAELPLSQVAGIPFETVNIAAEAATFDELYHSNSAYQEEWAQHGVEVLVFYGVPSNVVGAKEPIENLDWFKGKKVRGLGLLNEALQAVGASPVGLPVNEVYEALERGVVDGFSGTILEILPDQGWAEVADYVYEMQMGSPTFNQLVVSETVWADLPEDLREVIDEVSAEFNEQMVGAYAEGSDASCQKLRDDGVTLGVLDEAEVEEWKAAVGSSIADKWVSDTEAVGAPAGEFYDAYLELLRSHEDEFDGYELDMVRCVASG